MGYARLDDTFWMNEKVDALSDKAFRLYVRSISFASAMNTDGVISKRTLRLLEGDMKTVQQLVTAKMWETSGDGWIIHDYTEHNSSAEERKNRAQKAANARWGNDATSMRPASPKHATSMQPASIEQCDGDATCECPTHASQLIADTEQIQSSADAKHEHRIAADEPPPADAGRKPVPIVPKKTVVTQEWLDEIRTVWAPQLQDFDDTVGFVINSTYFKSRTDKRRYVEGKLKQQASREAGKLASSKNGFAQHGSGSVPPPPAMSWSMDDPLNATNRGKPREVVS